MIEDHIRAILDHIEPSEGGVREGLIKTPERVIKSWEELFSGYEKDPAEVLGTVFHEPGCDGLVVCKDIELYSTCEHHLLPFFGKASIGYFPKDGRIVGLSKLARIVEVFSRRLQNQERITQQIAQAIDEHLRPLGVAVVIEAEHFCMRSRGVNKQRSSMVTSHFLGTFKESREAREEFLQLVG